MTAHFESAGQMGEEEPAELLTGGSAQIAVIVLAVVALAITLVGERFFLGNSSR